MKTHLIRTTLALVCLIGLATTGEARSKVVSGVVNINTGTLEQLMMLPGIGRKKAEAIVAYRQVTPFKAVNDLVEIQGVGPKMVEKLAPYVAVSGTSTIQETSAAASEATAKEVPSKAKLPGSVAAPQG